VLDHVAASMLSVLRLLARRGQLRAPLLAALATADAQISDHNRAAVPALTTEPDEGRLRNDVMLMVCVRTMRGSTNAPACSPLLFISPTMRFSLHGEWLTAHRLPPLTDLESYILVRVSARAWLRVSTLESIEAGATTSSTR
jgi:hypothetical protein